MKRVVEPGREESRDTRREEAEGEACEEQRREIKPSAEACERKNEANTRETPPYMAARRGKAANGKCTDEQPLTRREEKRETRCERREIESREK